VLSRKWRASTGEHKVERESPRMKKKKKKRESGHGL
jgi:hypothetical protein